jgi:hypothetical protein
MTLASCDWFNAVTFSIFSIVTESGPMLSLSQIYANTPDEFQNSTATTTKYRNQNAKFLCMTTSDKKFFIDGQRPPDAEYCNQSLLANQANRMFLQIRRTNVLPNSENRCIVIILNQSLVAGLAPR